MGCLLTSDPSLYRLGVLCVAGVWTLEIALTNLCDLGSCKARKNGMVAQVPGAQFSEFSTILAQPKK